jgi:hypothetical protein
MPRNKKRRKPKDAENAVKSRQGSKDRDRKIADFWSRRIRAGLKAKSEYDSIAEEVMDFFKSDHARLYEDMATRQHFMDFQGSACLSIPKIAQMRNALGPRLYHAKPTRTVTPSTDDGVMRGLALSLRRYLNYTVREAKFAKQHRKAIDDGLLRGRGLLMVTWDDVRKVVTSRYVSSQDFVFDPDFDDIEDAAWIAIRMREPFWKTERRVTEKWRIRDLKAKVERSDTHAPRENTESRASTGPEVAGSAEVLEYWIVLSKMGKGFRGADMTDGERFDDSEDYCRLEIVLDHGVPIAEGKWDIPLYLDKDWPVAYFDPIETLDSRWPESPGGQILPLQKGVDLYTSLNLVANKNRNRIVVLGDARLEAKIQSQLRNGTSADYLSVDLPPGMSLESLVKVLDFGGGSTLESAGEREFLLAQMEATTGVTNAITGAEEQDAKDRSATASQMRLSAADARVADFKQKVEEFSTDIARKEALTVRLMLDVEDVSRIVRPQDINLYYVRIEPPGGAVVPVRDTRTEEERLKQPVGKILTLEQISPSAATYFNTPQEAFEAASIAWMDMQESEDPRVIQLAADLASQGLTVDDQLPMGVYFDAVDVERVWLDTAGITAEELMRELSWEIATGSGLKIDKAQERANADNLVQTVMPNAMAAGDVNAANQIMQIRDEAYEVPPDQRVQLSPPPPPTQQSGGEGDDEKGGDE